MTFQQYRVSPLELSKKTDFLLTLKNKISENITFQFFIY